MRKDWEKVKYFHCRAYFELLNREEVLHWIDTLLETIPEDEDLSEIYPMLNFSESFIESSISNITKLLYPDFEIASKEGDEYAKLIFIEYSEKYLKREISSNKFCDMVNQFDVVFIFSIKQPSGWLGEWLGNLYDTCDSCHDERWQHVEFDFLIEEVQKNLERIK